MRSRRGISTMVGAVFFIIAMTVAISYISYSMDTLDLFVQTVVVKSNVKEDQSNEEFEIKKLTIDNTKFNITLTNTGEIPINVTRLWVENVTSGVTAIDAVPKNCDIKKQVGPKQTVIKIGQSCTTLTAKDTKSYQLKLVTERGNTREISINSVGNEQLYIELLGIPSTVPTTFTSTLLLQVINNGTNQLVNLRPEIDSVDVTGCNSCTADYVSGPKPTSLDSLAPGDFGTFEYIYKFTGEGGDPINFTASLVNGVNEDWVIVKTQIVESAANANVALESGGIPGSTPLDDSILLFHMENTNVPTPGYQMMSADVDAGGLELSLDTVGVTSFLTNNGSQTIIVPAGKWNASLTLRSAELPASLVNDNNEDMIFHFEDGDGVPPDNSESDSDRDLATCGPGTSIVSVNEDDGDAEEDNSGPPDQGDVDATSSSDLEMPDDGGDEQIIGMRFRSMNIPQGATINGATILFTADETDQATNVDLDIWGEDVDDADDFPDCTNSCDDISNRQKTTAKVDWDNVPDWTSGERGPDTTTPELKTIVQEIVDRSGWRSGNDMVFIIEDDGSGTNERVAESHDKSGGTPAELTVNWSFGGGAPDWQPGSGPHGSGSNYFDGVNECLFSKKVISNGDGNNIDNDDDTTSLWFKTDGAVTSEQYLVYWGDNNDCPVCDSYGIALTGGASGGKINFTFNTDDGSDTTSCVSTLEYDDNIWHHVVGARDRNSDKCTLYITNLDGSNPESAIVVDNNYGSNDVDADGHWVVGTYKNTDGKWFKGWIDDIFHWNEDELSTTEVDELADTNFGTEAHGLVVNLNITDKDGVFVSNLYSAPLEPISFQDPKGLSVSDDNAYSNFNVTINLPQTTILPQQRLNFSVNYISPTAPWEDLELDMKIDDTGILPHSSYLQAPHPDNAFQGYVVYDNDSDFVMLVNNAGSDGIYFVYPGTRITFNGTLGSYAGIIDTINGTGGSWVVDENIDSIYIPSGQLAELYFNPSSDRPCQAGNCGTRVLPGEYKVSVWLNGYSDQGETFGRSVALGQVTVLD